ncbi:FAD/NAD(P)-binding protein [Comamonas sp. JC664]|nr:FAD/NAD(P)-binding protein [Comamonas sp. JC664]MBL0692231.1 FAD/NAD(P)-binding protein [Comamonas sp. JC664]GHG98129.1 pyridine nucleotide-disulfide oxidoreductase [Comamonas sp. KCTC 72670]
MPREDASERGRTYDCGVRAQGCWDVAIVGGGASGTLLAANLLRSARAPLRVALVERSGRAGLGLAYSTTSSCHLLNVPAAKMGAFTEDPEHFLRWVRREQPGTPPGAFIARQRYGRYLESVLREARANAAPGVHLDVVSDEVVSVEEASDAVRLVLADGAWLEAGMAVLALGNAPPSNLRVSDGGLYVSRRYHRSPWAPDALRGVKAQDDVLLIGTGLTMVDTVLSLMAQGHQGHIHALSRHGLLPHVHQEAAPSAYAAPGIRDALRALRQELRREHPEAARPEGHPPLAVRIRPVLRLVRREVKRAAEAGADWRTVVDALRPVSVPLWQRLPVNERRRFLRHLRTYWDVHRHRMAPSIGETVERLRREGQLTLHAGHIRSFALEDSGVEVRLRPRGRGDQEAALHVQHVINCTGPEGAMTRGHPVLGGLVETGRVSPDALGMGLAADAAGALLDIQGRASGRLYTLGPPRRGELWETTAVPEIRGHARNLAWHLLRRLEASRAPREPLESAGVPLEG